MASEDWYRQEEWSPEIEAVFFEKLRRARRKAQYLGIQAHILARRQPRVTLRLIDEYFKLEDHTFDAGAHETRAEAYLELGEIEKAIDSYDAALAREEAFPNVGTRVYLDFPYLIATKRIEGLYYRALDILSAKRDQLTFPVDHFLWHAAHALIFSNSGRNKEARKHAIQAFEAAQMGHSGFPRHPNIGLVGDRHGAVIDELVKLFNA